MEENHQVYFKDIRGKIIENIKSAKFEILIAVAWLTDEKIISELANSASRDVNISIIFYDDHINNKDLFKNLYQYQANIKFTRKLMHNKFCVIDRKIVINGSYNWTYNASSNHENITISANNLSLVNQFTEEFNKIFQTGNTIDFHFKDIVNEILGLEHEYTYYSDYKRSTIFPYFYLIDDEIEKIKFGYYFIKNKVEEEIFHRILYYRKLGYSIAEVNKITNRELKIPKRFDAVIKIRYIDNKIIIPQYYYRNTIGVEERINHKKYIYNIDNDGNQLGETKYYFEEKLSNGFYYYFYNPLNKSSKVCLYDSNLKKTELNIYSVEKIDNVRIFGKNNMKFGLYNFEGKLLVDHIYDGFKVLTDNNLIEFQEFPILVCESENPPKNNILSYDRYLVLKSEKGKETYLAKYYNLKTNKFETNNEIIINKKNGHTYFFSNERGGYYKELYNLAKNAQNKFTLADLLRLRDDSAYSLQKGAFRIRFESQQKYAKPVDPWGKERIEKQEKNCYIATMLYEDIDHPKVEFLRTFRDKKLSKYYFGIIFIKLYYRYSPSLVEILKSKSSINIFLKKTLDILIKILQKIE